ncbi:MAG: hypothetical protein M3154_00540 [Candidatus Eremiobacteraeota bacterium]|nr:hypothetical protein [Candidatus Eremiobacteraeota bacterium]
MEFEDFKQLWNEYDRKLGASLHLNTLLLQQANLGATKSSMRTVVRGLVLELIVNMIAVLLIGSFAAVHVAEAHFLIPSLVLGVYAILLVAESIRQMVAIHGIDYEETVVAIAKKLEQLRIKRISTVKWTLLTAPLLWMPLLIVCLRGFFGVDAYDALGAGYLAANLALGMSVIPLGLWVSRRYADRFERSSLARSLMDDVTGRSLLTALDSLRTILRFENEG